MYKTILVTLDGTPTDRAIIEHIKQLARVMQSRVVLLHVADGWAARTFGSDAVSPEVVEDRDYLEKVKTEFRSDGIPAEAELAYRGTRRRNRQMDSEKGVRSCCNEYTRPPSDG